ncbi:MAG TPA: NADH-quinone oxidoreductase subunit M [Polyangiaceae bacterium]
MSSLLFWILAAPAGGALLLLLTPPHMRRTLRWITLGAATASLGIALAVAGAYDRVTGGPQLPFSVPIVPTLGIALDLAVDGWGVPLLLLTALIAVAGTLASWTLNGRDKEFFILLLVLILGVLGVFIAHDLFVFFLFYEIAVLPMYLLIGIWGTSHEVPAGGPFRYVWNHFSIGGRQYAAMKLTLMLLVGSALILVAILALYDAHGRTTFNLLELQKTDFDESLQIGCFLLLWLGFGTLAGVFPFHTWSPDGHASAPTAVSMLHAGVLMKLGAFGVMRVGMVLLPEGARFWIPVVGAVAVVNIVYGALSALGQSDLKYVIAYSSVSHMGVVMLGAATLTPNGWNGAIYQMFAHGVMTALLFAMVGLIYERAHTRAIAKMGGFGKVMPGIAAFFTIACLSSLGLPGTAGFVAELLVFLGAWQGPHPWWALPGILGAFVTAVYALSVARRIFWGPTPSDEAADLTDARRTEWGAPILLGAAILVFGFWPRLALDFIDSTTVEHVRALTSTLVAGHP